MYPNDSHNKKNKNDKRASKLAEAVAAAEKTKTKNPTGVEIPLESEMSPPQLG